MIAKTGYYSAEYASSFAALGEILTLPVSGLRLIKRQISEDHFDLAGLYPYSMCRSFAQIGSEQDQAFLRESGAVAISFVAGPFCSTHELDAMSSWTVVRPFKTHLAIELDGDWRRQIAKKTRYYVRKGRDIHETLIANADRALAQSFYEMYQSTVRRHRITGVQRFSTDAILAQMQSPGTFVVRSVAGNKTSGLLICIRNHDHANYHLIAIDDVYYHRSTNAVLLMAAAEYCEELGERYLNIGGGAGMSSDATDGLYQFKRRWTPHQRRTYICGQILDYATYEHLCSKSKCSHGEFFPGYRAPGSALEWRPQYGAS